MARPHPQTDLYRKGAVTSASPLQLVVMLYDGALRHMTAGRQAMEAGDTFAQNKALQSAQRIIAELIACLDMQKGGDVAGHLLALYSYSYNNLVEGNLGDKPELIDQAKEVLSNLRAGWVELETVVRNGGSQVPDAA